MQNTHFSGLTRKNPVFERSVLKYVSIKNRILTPSGQKSRVCVNQPDRLLHPFRVEILSSSRLLTPQKQTGRVNQPKAIICPAGTAFRPSAMFGAPARRAARWGRLWGCAPCAAPLASPPEAPPKSVFNCRKTARARVLCCGSFPHSLRSLR